MKKLSRSFALSLVCLSAIPCLSATADDTGSAPPVAVRNGSNVDSGVGNTNTTGNSIAPSTPIGGALTDAEIAGVLKCADDAEIRAAELAKAKASSKDVQDFANHMISEHRTNEREGKRIEKKAGIHPKRNEQAKSIEASAKAKASELRKLRGTAFDNAYISEQVAMHQSLLNDLDAKFIPAARSPDMKAFLEKTRTHVQAHLDRAKTLLDQTNTAKE